MHVQEGLFLDPLAEHIRRVVPQLHRWTNITVRQRDKTPSRFSPQWVQQIPLLSKRCSPGFISCLKPHVGAWKIELHILRRFNYRILKVSFFAESGGMVDLQHLLHVFWEKKYSCFLPRLVIRKQSLSSPPQVRRVMIQRPSSSRMYFLKAPCLPGLGPRYFCTSTSSPKVKECTGREINKSPEHYKEEISTGSVHR